MKLITKTTLNNHYYDKSILNNRNHLKKIFNFFFWPMFYLILFRMTVCDL